jgi:HemY protein
MRFLFWFLLLAAAAVAAALAVKLNSGYVLLVTPPYRIELSLNLLLLIAVVGFATLYAAIRVAVRTARLPQTVRAWRPRQNQEQAP